jgi:heptosyltransferase-1
LHTQSKFRLLVVRLGAMGDILHALPAVTALRQAHPTWAIDWVVEPRWRALLAVDSATDSQRSSQFNLQSEPHRTTDPGSPLINRIHLAPAKQWGKSPLSRQTLSEIRFLRRELRACNYDAVIDFQGAIRSAWIARMAGCHRLIGESRPRELLARWCYSERVKTRGVHVIEQDVELASAVAGDELAPVLPQLPFDPVADAWADQILPSGNPVVLINPGAGWGAKRWPAERYAAVAVDLIAQGFRVVINIGPGEESLADPIVEATAGAAIPVKCSLGQLIAITRRVALCIAGDTGPLHLACALGRPVVGIYGPTDPSRNGPFGCKFKVLRSAASRRDHARRAEPEAGLLSIQPDDVLRAVKELLAEENAQ